MKAKLLKSLLVVILLISITVSYNMITNKSTQDYSKIATEQFTDDNSNYELKTQKSVVDLIDVLYWVSTICSLSCFYFIWKTKKSDELEEEKEEEEVTKDDVKDDTTEETEIVKDDTPEEKE